MPRRLRKDNVFNQEWIYHPLLAQLKNICIYGYRPLNLFIIMVFHQSDRVKEVKEVL